MSKYDYQTDSNKTLVQLSDNAIALYQAMIKEAGTVTTVEILRSVVEKPEDNEAADEYSFYNVTADKRDTVETEREFVKGIFIFPAGIPITRENAALPETVPENLIPTKAFFSGVDAIKEKDVIIYPFGDIMTEYEIVSKLDYGVVKPILTECTVALKRD